MTPTPLERFLGSLYRGGMVALGVTAGTLVLYIVGGFLALRFALLELSHPFLSLSSDPVLLFLISAGGFFITVAMLGLIFFVLLQPGPEEDVVTIVLLGSVAIGFGLSAFYYAVEILVTIVGS